MDEIIHKKLNLLVHIAKVDGKFANSEKALIDSLIDELNVDYNYESNQEVSLEDYANTKNKTDILYWALKLIKADSEIHPDESAYCKALALKLNFNPQIVDHFSNHDIGSLKDFKNAISKFLMIQEPK